MNKLLQKFHNPILYGLILAPIVYVLLLFLVIMLAVGSDNSNLSLLSQALDSWIKHLIVLGGGSLVVYVNSKSFNRTEQIQSVAIYIVLAVFSFVLWNILILGW